MHGEIVQAVLWCKLCNKPFNNDATLKRHGYYCRARKNGSTIRKRSCTECARVKTRCDGDQPGCSRCKKKGLQCHYRVKTSESIRKASRVEIADKERDVKSNSFNGDFETGDGATLLTQNGFSDPELEIAFCQWSTLNVDPLDVLTEDFVPDAFDNAFGFEQSWGVADQVELMPQNNAIMRSAIPLSPNDNVRWLIERPRAKPKSGSQGMINLMLSVLRSYPLTMLRHGTNPPFIHPYLTSSENEMDSMEPLNNCISLMHMISKNVKGSRKLFWRNVRSECEQWLAEYATYDKWKLLAVMQAILIYILLRVEEGETNHNNIDYLLLATVVALAKHMAKPRFAYSEVAIRTDGVSKESWSEWIFEESARRMCVIYRIINLVVYFDPALLCDLHGDLVVAPLPTRKSLWEAQNDLLWKAEMSTLPEQSPTFGLAANGELVSIEGEGIHCYTPVAQDGVVPSRTVSYKTANWEEWCSGMDSFGSLVMLAAALVADKL